jgi:LPXTG-site transpeptidase (sortase) family protein
LYGHYRPEVFARLQLIKPGSEAIITTDNGYKFYYKLDHVNIVDPNDTSLFTYQGTPELTIQTCTGSFFQKRQLFTFTFEKYEKL